MYILLVNLNSTAFKANDNSSTKNNFQEFNFTIDNLKNSNDYQELVKIAELMLSDEPLNEKYFLDPNNPIILSFKQSDGTLISKYFEVNSVPKKWSLKIGYLQNIFEDQNFKDDFLSEIKNLFQNDQNYDNFKMKVETKK